MRIEKTSIEGLLIIRLETFEDSRGFFVERFNKQKFERLGLATQFIQDNHSKSLPHVLRGLHLQVDPPQSKLVSCLKGSIFDVAVDLRPNSATYKQHFGITLDESDHSLFWIPEGFAHGFCVLGTKPAELFYKVNAPYNPKGEVGIQWNDPELAIPWPIKEPLLSDRDTNLKPLAEYDPSQIHATC